MDRKLFGLFSGTHLIFAFAIAVLAPGALYAAVTYTPVSITDPNTGNLAAVDNGRRLYTYNPSEGYTNNPSYLVNIEITGSNNVSSETIYTVPTGNVLLIKSITVSYYANTSGSIFSLLLLNSESIQFWSFNGANVADNLTSNFSAPVAVQAGDITYDYSSAAGAPFFMFIQGYLVPAGVVPAAGTAEAAQQFVRVGKPPAGRRLQ